MVSRGHTSGVAEPAEAGAKAGTNSDTAAPEPSVVEELFARIRADRAAAVVRAHQVLERPPDPSAVAPPGPVEEVVADEDEALLQRRDEVVERIEAALTRQLKRVLQDEQNDVLDRLRSLRRQPTAADVLPPADDQTARYRDRALTLLEEATVAGARFVDANAVPNVRVADLATDLAQSLVGPLRRRLEQAVDAADHEDRVVVVERIGAAYRECKGQRVERLAADSVIAAFSLGTMAAAPRAAVLRWVVDDDGGPCPDCDDNALAGPTRRGDAYPTGQSHPPAHAGCRCLLAVEST